MMMMMMITDDSHQSQLPLTQEYDPPSFLKQTLERHLFSVGSLLCAAAEKIEFPNHSSYCFILATKN